MNARDPWFPIALILTAATGAWLASISPFPFNVWHSFKDWQALIAALVALLAAYIAYWNAKSEIRQNDHIEQNRRSRKQKALRALLPLALSQITEYASRSAWALNNLLAQCANNTLPAKAAPNDLAQSLPQDTLKILAEFIEYSDELETDVLEATVAWMQIHDSRVRTLIRANHDPAGVQARPQVEVEVEGYIIDAVSIYSGAESMFNYARRRQEHLPEHINWEDVRNAMMSMRFWNGYYPRLYDIIVGREKTTSGPFDGLHT